MRLAGGRRTVARRGAYQQDGARRDEVNAAAAEGSQAGTNRMSTLMQRTVRAARAMTIAAACLSLTILAAAGSARAQQAPPKPIDPGDVALAERLFDTAKLTLS